MSPKFKPGGRKFPPKSSSTLATASTSSSSSAPNALNPEVEDQLEVELCWCIQQLELALNSGKLNERQSLETNKTLNVLKSSTAPLIKKRQFMRTTFGDYRTKMANDQKKLGKTSAQVKFANSNGSKKSIFLRKATAANTNAHNDINDSKSTNFRIIPSGDSFSFDFKDPEKS